MGRIWTGVLALGLMVLTALGAGEPAPVKASKDASYEALMKQYDEARLKHQEDAKKKAQADMDARRAELKAAQAEVAAAKTDEEKEAAQKRLQKARTVPAMRMASADDGPAATFSPRFLAFAVDNPKSPTALDAVYMSLVTSGGPTGKIGTWSRAIKTLQADHVASPELKRRVRMFRMLAAAKDDRADAFLREVMAKNPDHLTQGRACQALAQGQANAATFGERLKTDEKFRRNNEAALGGKEVVDRRIASAPAAKKLADELNKILREKYNDVCPDLSVGNVAPEVLSQGIDGKSVKLSELRGKVVVLDIWATWCGPCKAMIPHEREMVGRLQDKAFALVSISADKEKATLSKFLAQEKMPWTHWWNGAEGGILEDWNVEFFPTIYVLDARGVIRHKNIRGEKLEEAVNDLLKEQELKKAN